MKLILSYDEATKMSDHLDAMSPWMFENMRLETDDGTPYIGDIEIVFEEATSHLCSECGKYLEECICDEFQQEEIKTIPINNTIDLFPEDPDFDSEEPKINQEQYGSTDYNEIKEARKTIREAFDVDEQFKWGYICNIAMHLYDEVCKDGLKLNYDRRNEIAKKVLDVILYYGEK